MQAVAGSPIEHPDLLRADREAPAVALQHVGDADEAGDERVRRVLVDLGGRADLLDPALVEHGEAVAHRERLLLVVRDVDERDPDLALDALELDLHLLAQLQVERAERLVEQQHLRAVDDRARERDALALAAGELRRACGRRTPGGGRARAPPPRARRALGLGDLGDPQPVLDVLADGHVREQRVVLEDGVDVARVGRARRRRRCPPSSTVPASGRSKPAISRSVVVLPEPEGPSSVKNSPLGDVEVDAVHRRDVAVALGQPAQVDIGHGCPIHVHGEPIGVGITPIGQTGSDTCPRWSDCSTHPRKSLPASRWTARWRRACARGGSTSSSGRSTCSARARRCGPRWRRARRTRWCSTGRPARARRRSRGSRPSTPSAAFEELSAVNAGRAEVREVIARRPSERPRHARPVDDLLPRRDPPLQQGAAGRAAARGRGGPRHARSGRRRRTRTSRSTPRCSRGRRSTSCTRSDSADVEVLLRRALERGAGEGIDVRRRGGRVPRRARGRRRPDGAERAGAGRARPPAGAGAAR